MATRALDPHFHCLRRFPNLTHRTTKDSLHHHQALFSAPYALGAHCVWLHLLYHPWRCDLHLYCHGPGPARGLGNSSQRGEGYAGAQRRSASSSPVLPECSAFQRQTDPEGRRLGWGNTRKGERTAACREQETRVGFLRLSQRRQESGQEQGLCQRGKCWPGQAWPLRTQTRHTKLGCMVPAQELAHGPRPTQDYRSFFSSFPQNTLFTF